MATDSAEPTADFSSVIIELDKVARKWEEIARSQQKTVASLDKALGRFDTLTKSVTELTKSVGGVVSGLESIIASQKKLASQAETTTTAIQKQKRELSTPATTGTVKYAGDLVQRGFTKSKIEELKATPVETSSYKDAIGKLKDIVSRTEVSKEQLSKIWEELGKGEILAYSGSLRKVRNSMQEVLEAQNKLGASSTREQSRLAAEAAAQEALRLKTEATTKATREQEAAKKARTVEVQSTAKYARDLVQRGITQETLKQVGATPVEQSNYKDTIGRLQEVVVKANITREQLQKIWSEVGRGETQAYTGDLRRVRNALQDVKAATDQLGASSAKEKAQTEASAAAQAKMRLELEAANRAIIEQAAAKKAQQTLAREAAREIAGVVQKDITTEKVKEIGATQTEVKNYKDSVGRLKELIAKNAEYKDQAKKIWEELSRGETRAYVGELRKIRNAMDDVRAAQEQLGASAAKKKAQDEAEIATEERKKAKIDATTDALKRREAQLLKEATAARKADAATTLLLHQAPRTEQETIQRQVAPQRNIYQDAINKTKAAEDSKRAALESFNKEKAVFQALQSKLFTDSQNQNVDAYRKTLRELEAELIRLKTAQLQYQEASIKVKAAVDAEALAQQNLKKATQEATQAALASRPYGKKPIQGPVSAQALKVAQATPEETLAYKNAITRVRELRAQHKIAYADISRMWADLGEGKIKSYIGGLSDMQTALMKVRTTQSQLGTTFAKDIDAQAAAFFKSQGSMEKAGKAAIDYKKKLDELTISWKSFTRLLMVQVFHQAVSALMRTISEGLGTVIELGIRISEVKTISQDAQLSTEQWRQGFRRLSDEFGRPILDQVAAGYEAISDQIVKGAKTFQYLAEVNKFATATASSTLEAHQLLGSTMNAFGADLSQVDKIAASFFSTIDLGRVRATELATTFGQIAVPAHQFGVTLNELQALITTGTRQGIRYNTTATYLRNLFLKLQKPTEELKDYFKELGVNSASAAIATYGFLPFLTMLSDKFDDNSEEIAKLMGNIRAMQGALISTGKNLDKVRSDYDEIRKSLELYNNAVKITLEQTPEKKLQILAESFKNFFTVEIGSSMIAFAERFGVTIETISASLKALATTLIAIGSYISVRVLATLSLNPLISALLMIGTLATIIGTYYYKAKDAGEKLDEQTKRQQTTWTKEKTDAINEVYELEKAKIAEVTQTQLQYISTYRGLLASSIEDIKTPYTNFLDSVGSLEDKIIDKIRENLSDTRSEVTRLTSLATKKQKEFNEEMKVYDLIAQRRLTGKDRPDRREPDTEQKFKFVAGSLTLLEEELVEAAGKANEKRFEAIAAKMESTMKEAVDLSDKYAEEKGVGARQLIKSGEAYYRYVYDRIDEERNRMQRNASVQVQGHIDQQQALEDEISRVKDLAKIIKDISWTEIGKIKDDDKLKTVLGEQRAAFERLQEYGRRYGVDFYKKAQLALEEARVSELVILKTQEFQLEAQQQIVLKIKKRQEDELERNRLIWIEYVKDATDANEQVRKLALQNALEKSTRSATGKDTTVPKRSAKEILDLGVAEELEKRAFDINLKKQTDIRHQDRVTWQQYDSRAKESALTVEDVFNQIKVEPPPVKQFIEKSTTETVKKQEILEIIPAEDTQKQIEESIRTRQLLEKAGNQSTWEDYKTQGKEAIASLPAPEVKVQETKRVIEESKVTTTEKELTSITPNLGNWEAVKESVKDVQILTSGISFPDGKTLVDNLETLKQKTLSAISIIDNALSSQEPIKKATEDRQKTEQSKNTQLWEEYVRNAKRAILAIPAPETRQETVTQRVTEEVTKEKIIETSPLDNFKKQLEDFFQQKRLLNKEDNRSYWDDFRKSASEAKILLSGLSLPEDSLTNFEASLDKIVTETQKRITLATQNRQTLERKGNEFIAREYQEELSKTGYIVSEHIPEVYDEIIEYLKDAQRWTRERLLEQQRLDAQALSEAQGLALDVKQQLIAKESTVTEKTLKETEIKTEEKRIISTEISPAALKAQQQIEAALRRQQARYTDANKEVTAATNYRQTLEAKKIDENWKTYTTKGQQAADDVEQVFKAITILPDKKIESNDILQRSAALEDYRLQMIATSATISKMGTQEALRLFPEIKKQKPVQPELDIRVVTDKQAEIDRIIKERQDAEAKRNLNTISQYERSMVEASKILGKLGIEKTLEIFPELKPVDMAPVNEAQNAINAATQERINLEEQKYAEAWNTYTQLGLNAVNTIQNAVRNISLPTPTPVNLPTESYGRTIPRYASGKSAGIDTQMAMISPQEMIMNPAASRKFYSTLVALNASTRRFDSPSNSGPSYNVGDVIIQGDSKSVDTNLIRIGKGLRRQLRLGRLSLGT